MQNYYFWLTVIINNNNNKTRSNGFFLSQKMHNDLHTHTQIYHKKRTNTHHRYFKCLHCRNFSAVNIVIFEYILKNPNGDSLDIFLHI